MYSHSLYTVLVTIFLVNLCHGFHMINEDKDIRECVTEGRFPDPDDCGNFIDCTFNDHNESFHRFVGSCKHPKFRFYNPLTRICTDSKLDPNCQTTRESRALMADHNLDYACGEGQTGFICSDCKTLVNCLNGTAYPEPCGNGFTCYESDLFGGGVCYPGKPDECVCTNPNEFKVDKYDNNSFIFCEDVGKDPSIYSCPEDMEFDVTNHQCYNVEGLPPCSKIGVFANPYDCKFYYTCIMSTEGWVHKRFSCENETHSDLMFNEKSGRCEDPCSWDTGRFECEVEGRFLDPFNCKQYYECISLPSDPTKFRKTLRECPPNFEWDPEARGGVGHCVYKDDRVSECKVVTPNSCEIPEGMCEARFRNMLDESELGNLIV